MSVLNIYDRLRSYGLSHVGACAMLGNFEAESGLLSNNLQNDYEKKLGFVDELYTMAVDVGNYKNFAKDSAGYGLAQWTYGPRKKNLLEFANSRNASIGDENMQVDFAIHELRTEYSGLFRYLCYTEDMYEATSRICKEFERPAVNNIATRYAFAQKWDKEFKGSDTNDYVGDITKPEEHRITSTTPSSGTWYPPDQSILVLQAVLVANGYNTDITGYKSDSFFAVLREFVKDIGG